MPTPLDHLLERLDPQRVLEQVQARVDEAVNSFRLDAAQIKDWNRFKQCVMEFVRHVEGTALRLRSPVRTDPDYEWGRCVRLLMRRYGREGEKTAFELARTGNEGGLYAVLKAVAHRIAQGTAENEIAARVLDYWHSLSADQQMQASTEYLQKYGHLLPSELTEGSAARLRARLPKVLQEHPRMIQRLRAVARK